MKFRPYAGRSLPSGLAFSAPDSLLAFFSLEDWPSRWIKIVAGSVENFARRQEAEQDLRAANQELEKALSELKATQRQMIQQERLRALGQMASGIAHDFNNTLTPILWL